MFRVVLICLALLSSGCTSFENPIVAEHGPRLDPALIGRWTMDTEKAHLDLDIGQDGGEGRIFGTGTDDAQESEDLDLRLVTARLGQRNFASVKSRAKPESSWSLYSYELATPDLLLIRGENGMFWKDAVTNKLISGTTGKKDWIESVSVTASAAEMRAVVQGYDSVIFDDDVLLELHRTPR